MDKVNIWCKALTDNKLGRNLIRPDPHTHTWHDLIGDVISTRGPCLNTKK